MGCNPPGSSVHGIFQARILEWVAAPFSSGSSQPRIEPRSPELQADSSLSEPPGWQSMTLVGTKAKFCSARAVPTACPAPSPHARAPRPLSSRPPSRSHLLHGWHQVSALGEGPHVGLLLKGLGLGMLRVSPWPPRFLPSPERRPPLLSQRLAWGGPLRLEPGARSQQQQQGVS